MSHLLSFVPPSARVRRAPTAAWCRFLTGLEVNRKWGLNGHGRGRQILTEFVLMDDPVIRLICASDRVLRLTMWIIEPDDLIAALPGLGLTVLRVGDGLSHSKEVLP